MEYPGSLHNHSDFSNIRIRDSINKIPELVEYAKSLGKPFMEYPGDENYIDAYAQFYKSL